MNASLSEVSGRIHSFESMGAVDGPGLRYVVFMQGCPLRCLYCHNPDARPTGGGTVMTAGEVVERIRKCRSYLTNGGVTLSGGDPLMQPEFASAILRLCREEGFHTAVDTAAPVPLDVSRRVIDCAGMLLLDIKSPDEGMCRRISGAGLGNALAALGYCEETNKPVWIRHVLVPGMTFDRDGIMRLGRMLSPYKCVKRVDFLPYHKMGAGKWAALGLIDPLKDTPAAGPEAAEQAGKWFNEAAGDIVLK